MQRLVRTAAGPFRALIAPGSSVRPEAGQGLVRIILIAFLVLLVLSAIIRLFNIDPQPIILDSARLLGGGNLVEFNEAFTNSFDPTIRVCSVDRLDTDGDGFREWVVFYQTDPIQDATWRQPCPDKSPRYGAIYDNDRGEPAIVFPYTLVPPDRDMLGEEFTGFETAEIVANRSESERPIEELLIYGYRGQVRTQLTIFKFQQNTLPSDPPTNDPPRYVVLGAFVGSGGVSYDPINKQVTVLDRGPFERSQLAVKNVYALHGAPGNETYMSEPGASKLAAPIESTIDFAFGPPEDIFTTEFPEKIVLAFYQSLDRARDVEWDSVKFLAPVGTDETIGNAARNFQADNLAYFFASTPEVTIAPGDIVNLAVIQLRYFPAVEENPVTRTIEGPKPQRGRVAIQIEAQNITTGLMVYEMIFLNGEWKINQRLQ